jgi:hypothetical protein
MILTIVAEVGDGMEHYLKIPKQKTTAIPEAMNELIGNFLKVYSRTPHLLLHSGPKICHD